MAVLLYPLKLANGELIGSIDSYSRYLCEETGRYWMLAYDLDGRSYEIAADELNLVLDLTEAAGPYYRISNMPHKTYLNL